MTTQAIKPGPKRTAISTGNQDESQRDNKKTPGNTPPRSCANPFAFVYNFSKLKNTK